MIRVGRDFLKEEGTPGNDRVAVLTDTLWRTTYGADPGIVGKPVRIDGENHTVVGVLAYGPADRVERKLYLPLVFRPEQVNHDVNWLTVMGRLKPGVTLQQANAEMAVDRAPDRRGVPGGAQGLERQRRAAAEQLPRPGHDPRAVAAARRRSASCC